MQTLIDANLLRREETEDGEVRFTMLQTIREYALEELVASGEEPIVRTRHAEWAVALAELAEPRLYTAEEAAWLRRLRREQDNLYAALTWATRPEGGDVGLRLAGALADYWYLRGQIADGEERLRRALEATTIRNAARVKAIVGACVLKIGRGDPMAAIAGGEEALALATELGDRLGAGKALTMLGAGAQHQRQYARAFASHRQALSIFEEFGDEAWIHAALFNLAWTAHGMDDDRAAEEYAERLRRAAASTHDAFAASVTQLILGDLALAAGRQAAALARYREVLDASRRRGDRWLAADAFVGFAAVLAAGDEPERAARLLGAAEALYQRVGVPFPPRDRPDFPAWMDAIQTRLEPGMFDRAWTAGAGLTLTEASQDALAITTASAA